jgi:hypothetical protein
MAGGGAETVILRVGDWSGSEGEGGDADEVDGAFVITAAVLAHEEFAAGYGNGEVRGAQLRGSG